MPWHAWLLERLPPAGTLARYLRAQHAEDFTLEERSIILVIDDQHKPTLDKLQCMVKEGDRAAATMQRTLTIIPVGLLGVVAACFAYIVSMIVLTKLEGGQPNMWALVANFVWPAAIALAAMNFIFAFLVGAVQPAFVRGLTWSAIGLMLFLATCAGPICHWGMHALMPDTRGFSGLAWDLCGLVKCVISNCILLWGLVSQMPRQYITTIRYIFGLALVTTGFVSVVAGYFSYTDLANQAIVEGLDQVPRFLAAFSFIAVSFVVAGAMFFTNIPRNSGKWFLRCLYKDTYDKMVLCSTMAIMMGSSLPFDEVVRKSLRRLHCVSMGDVTFDEIKETTPNPKCHLKARRATFKEIDFFISHSWTDDPVEKWAVLQEVRADFKERHGREPLVWFDKCASRDHNLEPPARRCEVYHETPSGDICKIDASQPLS